MDTETLAEEWRILTTFLPEFWEELAWTTGALERSRKISDPDTLLLLIMIHAAGNLSLRQTTARAEQKGVVSISPPSLSYRLQKSEKWLQELARRMYTESRHDSPVTQTVPDHQLRVVDATNLQEYGSTGTDWRLHYVLQLPSLECDFFELTDDTGGETYDRVPVEPSDIILGDRGYAHREGVAAVVENDADVVVRLPWNNFPLDEPNGDSFTLFEHLRSLSGFTPQEWPVTFTANETTYPGRLCAIRRTQAAIDGAKRRAQKNGDPTAETLESLEYMFVLTTLSEDVVSTKEVLQLFAARWQIELMFKRLKSHFGMAHVPKQNEQSARAWIYAKLVAVLLIEQLREAADFFPWGFELNHKEPRA